MYLIKVFESQKVQHFISITLFFHFKILVTGNHLLSLELAKNVATSKTTQDPFVKKLNFKKSNINLE